MAYQNVPGILRSGLRNIPGRFFVVDISSGEVSVPTISAVVNNCHYRRKCVDAVTLPPPLNTNTTHLKSTFAIKKTAVLSADISGRVFRR